MRVTPGPDRLGPTRPGPARAATVESERKEWCKQAGRRRTGRRQNLLRVNGSLGRGPIPPTWLGVRVGSAGPQNIRPATRCRAALKPSCPAESQVSHFPTGLGLRFASVDFRHGGSDSVSRRSGCQARVAGGESVTVESRPQADQFAVLVAPGPVTRKLAWPEPESCQSRWADPGRVEHSDCDSDSEFARESLAHF